MKKTILTLICLGFLGITAFLGCKEAAKADEEAMAEPTFYLATAKEEIRAANKEFSTFFGSADSVGVANLYTTDGKFMMHGAPSIVGRESIASTMSGFINSGVSSVDLRTIEVWGTKDLVTEEGEYTLHAGDQQVDQGKYLVLWKKVDGKWYLFRDIFNSNLTPPE